MVSTTQGDAGFRNHPLYLNGCSTVYNNLNIRHFNISSIKKKHICLHQSQTLNQSEMSAEFLEPAPEPGFWKTTFQQEKLHWSYSWMVHPCISPDPYSMFDFIPVTSFIANNRIYIYTVHSIYIYIYWLVGGFNPSEKWWSSSVGMMTFPIYGTKKCSKAPNKYYIPKDHKMKVPRPRVPGPVPGSSGNRTGSDRLWIPGQMWNGSWPNICGFNMNPLMSTIKCEIKSWMISGFIHTFTSEHDRDGNIKLDRCNHPLYEIPQ